MSSDTFKYILELIHTSIKKKIQIFEGREGLDEASLLELQNQEDSFSTNLDELERRVTRSNNRSSLRARRLRDAFTVIFQ